MDFGEVLSKAWKIVWKHKVLWIFGILAGCGSGFSSNGSNSFRNTYQGNDFPQVQRFIENIPVWVWILAAVAVVVLVIAAIFLGTIGRIGLIKGAMQADEGAASLSFGTLFNESLHYFWRVFGFSVLSGLAIVVLVAVITLPFILIGLATAGIGLICLIPVICLLVPVFWVISLVIEQSTIAIVVEDVGIFAGLGRGWNVIVKNIGSMIIMALILMIGGGIVSFIIALPMFLIIIPPAIGYMTNRESGLGGGLLVAGILFLVYLPFLLAASGLVTAYISSAWTLTFRRLTVKRPAAPEVVPVEVIPPAV